MRSRPVAEVIDELRRYPSDSPIIFTDDNLGALEKETINLLKEIIRVKEAEDYRWTFYGQFSTLATRNDELIELAGRAGFVTAFIGIESIEPESLCLARKEFNLGSVDHDFLDTLRDCGLTRSQIKESSQRGIQVVALRKQGVDDKIIKDCIKENYLRIFRRLTAAGIYPLTSVIYGFDGDTIQTIRETTHFLIDAKIPLNFQWILVPGTGTPLAKRLEKERRLDTPLDLKKSDGRYALFRPKKMSREELEQEFWASYRRFYSVPSILKRVLTSSVFFKRAYSSGIIYTNFFYRSAVRNNIQPLSAGYRSSLETPEFVSGIET